MQEFIEKPWFGKDDINNFEVRNEIYHWVSQIFWRIWFFIKDAGETLELEPKEQKGGFLSMLLGTLHASLLWNMLAIKGVRATRWGSRVLRVSEKTIRKQNFYYRPVILKYKDNIKNNQHWRWWANKYFTKD